PQSLPPETDGPIIPARAGPCTGGAPSPLVPLDRSGGACLMLARWRPGSCPPAGKLAGAPDLRAAAPSRMRAEPHWNRPKGLNMAAKLPFQAGGRGARSSALVSDAGRDLGFSRPRAGSGRALRWEGLRTTP